MYVSHVRSIRLLYFWHHIISDNLQYPLAPITFQSVIMEYKLALDGLQDILKPFKLVVWGEVAMAHLGVPIIPYVCAP